MIGTIIGDIYGSPFEYKDFNRTDFKFDLENATFTDDTVLTVAIADALLNNLDFKETIIKYCKKYPDSRYGSKFKEWFNSENPKDNDSFGNGSAMRISSIPLINKFKEFNFETTVEESVKFSHGHREGIKGAKAIARSISLLNFLREEKNPYINNFLPETLKKKKLKEMITESFSYNINLSKEELHKNKIFDATCQITVPQAINVFLVSNSFEETIKNAILIKGDTDTIAAMAGGLAEACYGLSSIPKEMINTIEKILPIEFKEIINKVYQKEILK